MSFSRYKKVGALVISVAIPSLYASGQMNSLEIETGNIKNNSKNVEWPKNCILFKVSNITADESGLDKEDSEITFFVNETLQLASIGEDFSKAIFPNDYEKNKDILITSSMPSSEFFTKFRAVFVIDKQEYSCYGMSLKEFQQTYKEQFDTVSNSKLPPQRWAISVSGSGKYMTDINGKGNMVGRMSECKWQFWPIMEK